MRHHAILPSFRNFKGKVTILHYSKVHLKLNLIQLKLESRTEIDFFAYTYYRILLAYSFKLANSKIDS